MHIILNTKYFNLTKRSNALRKACSALVLPLGTGRVSTTV